LKEIYSTFDLDDDDSESEIFPLDYVWMTLKFAMEIGVVSFFQPKTTEARQRPFLKLSFENFNLNLEQRLTSNHMQLDLKTLV